MGPETKKLEVGSFQKIEIEKVFAPTVADDIRLHFDPNRGWVIELHVPKEDGLYAEWQTVANVGVDDDTNLPVVEVYEGINTITVDGDGFPKA